MPKRHPKMPIPLLHRFLQILLPLIIISCLVFVVGMLCILIPPKPSDELLNLLHQKREIYATHIKNHQYAILVNYDLPIYKERLWIIDVEKDSIVLSSRVSHAANSGWIYAHHFSNVPESNTSSVGVFVTGNSYYGNFGYSMKLHGLEKGKNDHAFKRYIVVHAHPFLYSWGCFMTKREINDRIVDLTKNGALLYVHHSKTENQ